MFFYLRDYLQSPYCTIFDPNPDLSLFSESTRHKIELIYQIDKRFDLSDLWLEPLTQVSDYVTEGRPRKRLSEDDLDLISNTLCQIFLSLYACDLLITSPASIMLCETSLGCYDDFSNSVFSSLYVGALSWEPLFCRKPGLHLFDLIRSCTRFLPPRIAKNRIGYILDILLGASKYILQSHPQITNDYKTLYMMGEIDYSFDFNAFMDISTGLRLRPGRLVRYPVFEEKLKSAIGSKAYSMAKRDAIYMSAGAYDFRELRSLLSAKDRNILCDFFYDIFATDSYLIKSNCYYQYHPMFDMDPMYKSISMEANKNIPWWVVSGKDCVSPSDMSQSFNEFDIDAYHTLVSNVQNGIDSDFVTSVPIFRYLKNIVRNRSYYGHLKESNRQYVMNMIRYAVECIYDTRNSAPKYHDFYDNMDGEEDF